MRHTDGLRSSAKVAKGQRRTALPGRGATSRTHRVFLAVGSILWMAFVVAAAVAVGTLGISSEDTTHPHGLYGLVLFALESSLFFTGSAPSANS